MMRPVPPHPDCIWRCNPTSPRKRGEVCSASLGYNWAHQSDYGITMSVIGGHAALCPSYGSLRHCERSEAIQGQEKGLDCFVASLLAMTSSHFGAMRSEPSRR